MSISNPMRRRNLRTEELINPADLNRKVTLLEKDGDDNRSGGKRNVVWKPIEKSSKVWANIHNFRGSEQFQLNQKQAELTHRITIRYRKDITRLNRVRYRGREFKINYIINPDEANRFLSLYVTEEV